MNDGQRELERAFKRLIDIAGAVVGLVVLSPLIGGDRDDRLEIAALVGRQADRNLVDDLGKADKPIQRRMVKNLKQADATLGKRVATGLKLK